MRLAIPDALALMATLYGSNKSIGEALGVSHQRVTAWFRGRGLRVFDPPSKGGDPFARQAFAIAWGRFFRECRKIANDQGLPFDRTAPAYWHRRPMSGTGKLGDRVFLYSTHHISPQLRMYLIDRMRSTGLYVFAQVESIIDLTLYFDQAEDRIQSHMRTERQAENRATLQRKLMLGRSHSPIYTKRIGVGVNSSAGILNRIEQQLRQKHEPATGMPGTVLASAFILQLHPQHVASPDGTPRPKASRRNRRSSGKRQ